MKNYLEFFLNSLFRVAGEPEQMTGFIRRFHELFIGHSPGIARQFAGTEMSRQVDMLAQSPHEMVEFSSPRVASERLRQVALRHSRRERDVCSDLYEAWLSSPVAAAR